MRMTIKELREKFADQVHAQWCHWMKYLMKEGMLTPPGAFTSGGQFILPLEKIEHWKRQMETPYIKLSEEEKNSNRDLADCFIRILQNNPSPPGTLTSGVQLIEDWVDDIMRNQNLRKWNELGGASK